MHLKLNLKTLKNEKFNLLLFNMQITNEIIIKIICGGRWNHNNLDKYFINL